MLNIQGLFMNLKDCMLLNCNLYQFLSEHSRMNFFFNLVQDLFNKIVDISTVPHRVVGGFKNAHFQFLDVTSKF